MESRNKKILGVVITVIVLFLLLLLVWISTQQTGPGDITITNTAPDRPADTGILNTTFGAGVERPVLEAIGPAEPTSDPEAPDPRSNLKRLAHSFAERYGSFSNQGDFENLKELRAFMTDSMVKEVDAYIAEASARGSGTPAYVGMTTRALSSAMERIDEGSGTASIRVNTQRQETTSAGTRVFYQEITIDFIRSGEIWEVDSAEWLG
ncbi:MAG: hypothetical protein U9Q03_04325 [Patescibacteria group bacterium]|nr:hypothetical protein [Patescibacteria group bacterium]